MLLGNAGKVLQIQSRFFNSEKNLPELDLRSQFFQTIALITIFEISENVFKIESQTFDFQK